jgi:hypothetical protein
MGKYKDFIQPLKPKNQLPSIIGSYGCQACDEYTNEAWFDEQKGCMFWFCSENHRSEIKVGV